MADTPTQSFRITSAAAKKAAEAQKQTEAEAALRSVNIDIDDVAALDPLTEAAMVALIGARYEAAPLGRPAPHHLIYTRAGPIIVAVNPLTPIPALYTKTERKKYYDAAGIAVRQEKEGIKGGDYAEDVLPPHIYEISGRAYHQVCDGKSQAVVINGESGAGKTETAKLLLQHLSEVSGGENEESGSKTLASKLLASSPVLEAFGNAKTLRNDNSSRFGKLMKLHFNQHDGKMRHATVNHYLLEKSRVVQQQVGEQAFHAFYYLCAGAEPARREALKLGAASSATSSFGYLQLPDKDLSGNFVNMWKELQAALSVMLAGKESVIDDYWRTTATILHLGGIEFSEISSQSADPGSVIVPASMPAAQTAAALLGCTVEELSKTFCVRSIMGADVPRSPREARVARDTTAKAMYERLFNELVAVVNMALLPEEDKSIRSQRELFIGLLDIFGSEIFESNGFEQLLINYANDKLQHYFTQTAISAIMAEYKEEEIDTTYLMTSYSDISPTLELIEGVPVPKGREGQTTVCLLSLLDDDTRYSERAQERDNRLHSGKTGSFDQKKMDRSGSMLSGHTSTKGAGVGAIDRDNKFVLKVHDKLEKKAGFVTASGKRWDTKENRWVAVDNFNRKLFTNSHFAIKHFGATVPYQANQFCDKNIDPVDKEILSLMSGCATTTAGKFIGDLFAQYNNQHRSISFKFRDEMAGLVDTLSRCDGHFIRCIKPNDERKPFHLDPSMSKGQLQSCGVHEAAKVSQAGYPRRIPYRDFFAQFMGAHAFRRVKKPLDDQAKQAIAKSLALKVLRLCYVGTQADNENAYSLNEFELGKTRIFLKRGVWEKAMLRQRMLIDAIGVPAVGGPKGTPATGLRMWRVRRRIHLLTVTLQERLKDRAYWAQIQEEHQEAMKAKKKAEEDKEKEREKGVLVMMGLAKIEAADAARAEAVRSHEDAMRDERERHASFMKAEMANAAEEKTRELELLAAKHAAELEDKNVEIEKAEALQAELRREKASLEQKNEELHEWRREVEWQHQEIDRLEAKLRAAEREAEAMIVEHTVAEIDFYSDHEKLCTELKRQVTFQGLKHDAAFWFRRGDLVNSRATTSEESGLDRIGRMRTKAARAIILHATSLAEQQIATPPWKKYPFLKDLLSAEEEKAETDRRERQRIIYQLSAANMTKKLDTSAALAEYEDALKLLKAHKATGVKTFDDLLDKAIELQANAEKEVAGQMNENISETSKMPARIRARSTYVDAILNSPRESPAQLVPPFYLQTRPATADLIGFEYSAGRFSVNLELEALRRVKAAGFAPYSAITPLKKLTLSDAEKAKNLIPKESTLFAFAFPLSGSLGIDFEPTTPEEEAMATGAFVYFKDADHLISMNAVTFAPSGLLFDGPHVLLTSKKDKAGADSSTGKKKKKASLVDGGKLREFLIASGRVNPVTAPALKSKGVEYFWWLGPGEPVAQEDGSAWKHGAFVYLYCAGNEGFDCFLECRGFSN